MTKFLKWNENEIVTKFTKLLKIASTIKQKTQNELKTFWCYFDVEAWWEGGKTGNSFKILLASENITFLVEEIVVDLF